MRFFVVAFDPKFQSLGMSEGLQLHSLGSHFRSPKNCEAAAKDQEAKVSKVEKTSEEPVQRKTLEAKAPSAQEASRPQDVTETSETVPTSGKQPQPQPLQMPQLQHVQFAQQHVQPHVREALESEGFSTLGAFREQVWEQHSQPSRLDECCTLQ